ncbi:hypothetical protein NLJ89_g9210 [Agrocybe chaxingu]|uniref:Ubiquitin-like domain-containing protein n=1 Tax=Agrocybe chaxingu TaxID=84603 RepID=A0A9W8JTI3_9AGAR|nr:hypothetical protein NLJ89_g9210 [Agrocybe chaxingu]
MYNPHGVPDAAGCIECRGIYEPRWFEDPTLSPPLSLESPQKPSKFSAPVEKPPHEKLMRPSRLTDDFFSVLGAVILYTFTNNGDVTTLIKRGVPQCRALPPSRLPLICLGTNLNDSDTLASYLRLSLGPSKTIPLLPSSADLSRKDVLYHWTILVLVVVSYAWGFYNLILVLSWTWTRLSRKRKSSQSPVPDIIGSFHESEIAYSSSIADVEEFLEAIPESEPSVRYPVNPAIAKAFDRSPTAQVLVDELAAVNVSLNVIGAGSPSGYEASSKHLSGEVEENIVDFDDMLVFEALIESKSEEEVSEMVVQVPRTPPMLNPDALPFVPQVVNVPTLSVSTDGNLDSDAVGDPEIFPVTVKTSIRRCCKHCPRWYRCTGHKST